MANAGARPMLATAVTRLPSADSGYIYECKWDGIRALVDCRPDQVRVHTRNGGDITASFGELERLAVLGDVLLDGELVVFRGQFADFGAVVSRMHSQPGRRSTRPATLVAFDVLRIEGQDVRSFPWTRRRKLLNGLPTTGLPAVVSPAGDDPDQMLALSAEAGAEGVVAKRVDSPYRPGRSRDWLKLRHTLAIDCIVGGWRTSRRDGLSLLLGTPTTSGRLTYIGRVHRGVAAHGNLLRVALGLLATEKSPFDPPPPTDAIRDAHWLLPILPVEVTCTSRLPDGRLRQPALARIRVDLLT